MIDNFGPNSKLITEEGQFSCRAGSIISTNEFGLVAVTAKLPSSIHTNHLFWRDLTFENVTDKLRKGNEEADRSAKDLLSYFRLPDALERHSKLCSDIIWPREIAPSTSLLGAQIFSNEDLKMRNPLGKVIGRKSQVILENQGPNSTDMVISGVSIISLYNSGFMSDGLLGASVIDEKARLIGLCMAKKIYSDNSQMDVLVVPGSDIGPSIEYSLWSPPGAHWLDLIYRSTAFRSKTKSINKLNLGEAP